jgi:hypothetical protein
MSHPESGCRCPGIAPVIDPAQIFMKRKWYKKIPLCACRGAVVQINNKILNNFSIIEEARKLIRDQRNGLSGMVLQ